MADGLLFNTIEKLIGKLGSMAVEDWNVSDDVEKLVESMSEIKAVILDAEQPQKQGTNSNQVQLWLQKLKDALDDADDLLDDFSTEHLRRRVMTKDKKAKQVRIFFSSSNQLVFSFKMAQKIKDLRKRIEGLNIGGKVFNFTNRTPEQRVVKQRETHSFIREEEVIGREDEKEELIKKLLNTDIKEKDNVSVISIIGFGGLGKTALAQLVYNDKAVQEHFELKAWVCVADEDSNVGGFDVKGVAAKIVRSMTNDEMDEVQRKAWVCVADEDSNVGGFDVKGVNAKIVRSKTNDEMDEVQRKLRKKVERKRYLLVLDDIWTENRESWLQLMTFLVGGAKGSKILVTTRSKKVAQITGTSSSILLKGLDETQSWKLFSRLAFENRKEPEIQNLVSIGKEIVKKCAGVPLAIRSIGSLMYSMETEKDWSSFKNKDLMKIDEEGGNAIFQLIKLSYDHLPFHLKKCFAFCSLFPKDYEFEKTTLIRLWIAQGFVESADESTSLEDTGDKYLTTLFHRSFFQNFINDDTFDDILYFKMHDLVHEMATQISRNDYVLVNEKMPQHIDKETRHVSFGFAMDSSWQVPSSLFENCKLRTLLLPMYSCWWEASIEESVCNSIMSCSKKFRALNLIRLNSRNIPSCIGMMKHLRYLDLSYSEQIEVLPRSITKLNNLETLLLNWCTKLRELPKDLWKLASLRHLELDYCDKLTFMPCGIGQLTNLQTLTLFVLDTTSKQKHSARASELGKLNNLRGKLEIKGLECLRRSPTEAAAKDMMNLMGKPHLQSLTLHWGAQIDESVEMEKDDIILQGLHWHPNIKVLQIRGFGGLTFSRSVNLFTNLKALALLNCTRLQYLPQLHVKTLSLQNLPCLEWIVNDNNINGSSSTLSPSLTKIYLVELPNLKGWCRCSQEEMQMQRGCCHHQLNSLVVLCILDCRNLISIPQPTKMKILVLDNVREKILQQLVNNSEVEDDLIIRRMDDLKSLSGVLQHLTTLRGFRIEYCKELDPCNDEDGCYMMQWKELKNLKLLEFNGIPKMEYLPEGLQHVPTLQTLRITDCDNLTSIPEWVTSLQVLDISNCPKLTSVPKGVQVKKED